ncbi:MAG: hypothetical protein JNN03_08435 [Rubrivivax sp.]|nr:hypothetical protein [Rubrivivax sp.]
MPTRWPVRAVTLPPVRWLTRSVLRHVERSAALPVLLGLSLALVLGLVSGCGGADDADPSVEPLALGAGTYFTTDFLSSDASFYRVNEFSGETEALIAFSEGAGGTFRCPALAALDTRGDGMVLSAARRSASLYESDPRNGLCRLVGTLPETMVALAVRADGRLFTVSATNKLYQLDAQGRPLSAAVLLCPPSTPTCPVRGLDFSPAGTLHAIVAPGLWSRIDATSAQLTSIRTGVGLSDDFDIDAQGRVRGLAGDELRFFDLAGNPSGRAVNVFGGTAFATGLVHR